MSSKSIILLFVLTLFFSQSIVAEENDEILYFDQESFDDIFKNSTSSELSTDLKNMFNEIPSTGIDFNDNTSDVPIDGGLGFLLAAGLGYGANRLRKLKNKDDQKEKC
jgi:lipopolysaccharide assembly outer membrane protein LptD (OstA)